MVWPIYMCVCDFVTGSKSFGSIMSGESQPSACPRGSDSNKKP